MSRPGRKMSAANQKMAEVQYKIRQNASEMQDYMKSLGKWEKDIKKKEKTLKKATRKSTTSSTKTTSSKTKARHVPAVRGTKGSTVYASTTATSHASTAHPMLSKHLKATGKSGAASESSTKQKYRSPAEAARARRAEEAKKKTTKDSHTYDKGYKKWENFDVDAELAKVDQEDDGSSTPLPPSSLQNEAAVQQSAAPVRNRSVKGKKRVSAPSISREELYKQDGNKHYGRGEFQQSIKCYTRCIAANPRNAVAYSNRAQAHVKLKNFLKAEEDCSSAIMIAPEFVKSWTRRGTARNSLGRHRAALRDFEKALVLEPSNKKLHTEVRKTREAIKSCVRRTPRQQIPVREIGSVSDVYFQGATNQGKEEQRSFGPTFTEIPDEAGDVAKVEEVEEVEEKKKQVSASAVSIEKVVSIVEEESAAAAAVAEEEREGEEATDMPIPTERQPTSPGSDSSWVVVEEEEEFERRRSEAKTTESSASSSSSSGEKKEERKSDSGDDEDDEKTVLVPEIPNELAPTINTERRVRKRKNVVDVMPKTSYEFVRVWRSINDEEKIKYVKMIGAKSLPKLFKQTGIETDMLEDLLRMASTAFTSPKLLLLCDGMAKTSRFATALMFLGDAEKETMLSTLSTVLMDSAIQEKYPKRHGRVSKAFGV